MMKKNKPTKRLYIRKVPPSCKVYTPPSLAHAMAATLGNVEGDSWLEPSIGTGALLSALRARGVSKHQIIGIDLDRVKQELDSLAKVSRGVDFLAWSQSTRKRFDKIICNPPYVAIEKLQSSVRRSACRIKTLNEVQVSAAANLWYAFLCAAINLLKEKGSLCFVLPAAWDFANYARPLRTRIADAFEHVEVYRCAEPLFHAAEIQDGAVILVARRKRGVSAETRQPYGALFRREFSKGVDLIRALRTARPILTAGPIVVTTNREITPASAQPRSGSVRLGDITTIQLGGVTGDAGYFLLTEAERLEWSLPTNALRPIVSRAKHLQSAAIAAHEWRTLRELGERVWLFRPPAAAMTHWAVRAYLAHGKRGGCNLTSHKIANRLAWHRTPLPRRIDAFISGMSQFGPWLTFCDMPRLTASNTLYVVTFKEVDPQYRAAVALSLLSSYVQEQLPALGRHYADGLVKFEPGDLCEVRLLLPDVITPAKSLYQRAVRKMLSGEMKAATAIADCYCDSLSTSIAEHVTRVA